MFEIIHDYTPEIEQCSIDEGYFDVSGRKEPIEEIAGAIRDRIARTLQLPVSFGMGTNKLVTQIASKLHKPESFCVVPRARKRCSFIRFPIAGSPESGKRPVRLWTFWASSKCIIFSRRRRNYWSGAVGSYARELRQYATGIDERPVVSTIDEPKSYGQQRTFSNDLSDAAK
jgi:DNA polymerase-4